MSSPTPPGMVSGSSSDVSPHAVTNPARKSLRERLPSTTQHGSFHPTDDGDPSTSNPPVRALGLTVMSPVSSTSPSPVLPYTRLSITTASVSSTPIHRAGDLNLISPNPIPSSLTSPLIPTTFPSPSPTNHVKSTNAPPSPRSSEDTVNWQRRMQRIETTSARRTSVIARTGGGSSRSLNRAHSFSAATIAAAGGTGDLDVFSPTPMSQMMSPNTSRQAGGAKKVPHPHLRSMSNVVDWTPYNKRKNKPTSVAPFSPTKTKSHSFERPMALSSPPSLLLSKSSARLDPPPPPTPYSRYLHLLYTIRSHHIARTLSEWTHSTPYFTACIVLTLFSLYAEDVNLCWFPPSADLPISILLTITLSLFSIDILVCCTIRPGYFLSFFFFLDLIGTLSLMLDISFMVPLNLNSVHDGSSSQHLNQSGNILRITRFVRLFRVMQVLRVVKLFKFHAEVEGRVGHTANKVGLQLSELIDKRVISMLFGLIIILPFFTVDDTNYGMSEQMGINILEALVLTPTPTINSTADQMDYLTKYEAYHPYLLYLSFPTSPPFIPVSQDMSNLRSHDIDTFVAPLGSTALFDLSNQYYTSSLYSIILTSIIIAMFMAGSVLISKDVHQLVVAPLERMTSIIKKLAGTICFLTHDEEERSKNSQDNSEGEPEPSNETRVIEGIIEKLATIFQVQPDASMQGPKALQRMAGSKHTEITTNTSVVSIAVVERPRDDIAAVDDDVGSSGMVGPEVDPSKYKELRSVEDGMAHPGVLPHFRLYLTTNLLMENLLFYQEVERYKAILSSHSTSLYSNFISSTSSSQVNISASLHDRIKEAVNLPCATMFDEAQAECVMLMKAHVRGFSESKFAQLYLKKKERQGGSEVMYKKRRGGGGLSKVGDELGSKGYAPSQRGSVIMQRGRINESEEEDEEEGSKDGDKSSALPIIALPHPHTTSTPVLSITQTRPLMKGKMKQARLSTTRSVDLEAEIAALENPGAEAAALFNPTGKKVGEMGVRGKKKEGKEVTEVKGKAEGGEKEGEGKGDGAEVKEEVRAGVEALGGSGVQGEGKGEGVEGMRVDALTEVHPIDGVGDGREEVRVGSGVVGGSVDASAPVDSEVEEEVARLLVEATTSSDD